MFLIVQYLCKYFQAPNSLAVAKLSTKFVSRRVQFPESFDKFSATSNKQTNKPESTEAAKVLEIKFKWAAQDISCSWTWDPPRCQSRPYPWQGAVIKSRGDCARNDCANERKERDLEP